MMPSWPLSHAHRPRRPRACSGSAVVMRSHECAVRRSSSSGIDGETFAPRAHRGASRHPTYRHVEEERRSSGRSLRTYALDVELRRPNRRIVVWKGCGVPSDSQRDHLSVEDELIGSGAPRTSLDDLGHRRRHLFETPRVHRDVLTALVYLNASTVELEVEHRFFEAIDRLAGLLAGLGEHRLERAKQL